ncbi:hypothetical protein STHAL_32370 [Streptomyces halstedii]|uniref:Uncharacterized protein n=1 Tax=Streptomyces halstedii TaxID=1944 RepID=A0ABS6U198_STRHA|nr:hypothetical protein [Streptomyces halstedii]MBV7674144.1 hypothetical protein [Streptomyces halstedii]
MSSHTQRLREDMERRRREREAREAAQPPAGQDSPEDPSPDAPSALPVQQQKVAARPQPFTADLLPSTDAVDASGELSVEELDELERCERAFANADQAQWMRGQALHAVRDRKLFRQEGRTWADYCEEIGLSESDANRMIQEYPLARAIAQIWVTPKMVPASHVRALLPLTAVVTPEDVARGYVDLRLWAQERRQRVTAADLTAIIEQTALGAATAEPLPVAVFEARRKAIEAAVPTQSGPPLDESSPSAATSDATGGAIPSHPNLGDPGTVPEPGPPASEASSESQNQPINEIVDAEIVLDESAKIVNAALLSLCQGIDDALADADAVTLKQIIESSGRISDAAQSVLRGRR